MEPAAFSARELLALLAEEDRLKVVSALVLGATSGAGISQATGLSARRAGKALARLTSGGLVEADAAGYRLRAELFRETAIATDPKLELEPGPPGSGGEEAAVLSRFIRGHRLSSIPAARGKRLLVLDHLAGLFEPGRRYDETEVNEILGAWHPDYATLRRYLVDEGFLRRKDETAPGATRSVKRYWRTGGSFDVD